MPWNINSHNVLMNHIFYNSLNSQVHTGYVGKIVFIDKNNNYHNVRWSPNHEINDWVYTYENKTNLYHYKNGQGTCRICGWNNIYTSTSERHAFNNQTSYSNKDNSQHYKNFNSICNLNCGYSYSNSISENHNKNSPSWTSWKNYNATYHRHTKTYNCNVCNYLYTASEYEAHVFNILKNWDDLHVTKIDDTNHGHAANYQCYQTCGAIQFTYIYINSHKMGQNIGNSYLQINATHHKRIENRRCHSRSESNDNLNYCHQYYNVNTFELHNWDNSTWPRCVDCGYEPPDNA